MLFNLTFNIKGVGKDERVIQKIFGSPDSCQDLV